MVANAVSIPTECCPKISEFMKRNWPVATRIEFIKGNHGFYNRAKPKNLKSTFWAEKFTKIVLIPSGGWSSRGGNGKTISCEGGLHIFQDRWVEQHF